MKGIVEEDVCYEFSVHPIGQPDSSIGDENNLKEVIVSDEGVMYFTGSSIYLGREGRWYRIHISDIKLIVDDDDGSMVMIMKYRMPDNREMEIRLDSKNRSHIRALKHILVLYKDKLSIGGDL